MAEKVFTTMGSKVSKEIVGKVNATYRFDLSKGGATRAWMVDLKNGNGKVSEVPSNPSNPSSALLRTNCIHPAIFPFLRAACIHPAYEYLPPQVTGKDDEAQCNITMSEEDFLALMDGSLDGQSAFLGGQLKVHNIDTVVTKLLLHCCYTVVTLSSHCSHTAVTLFHPHSEAELCG
jgi:hypothetical protein